MTWVHWLLAAVVGLSACYWLGTLLLLHLVSRAMPVLARETPPDPPRWPRLSVIVPARNEGPEVEAALRSRLADDYPEIEFILVNDRSEDATGEIIARLAAEDPRVKAIHVRELPADWLGKLHAMQLGYEAASGEWLLFSDADVHCAPGTMRRAVAWSEAHGVDHLPVIPDLWPSGLLVDMLLSAFGRTFVLAARPRLVANPKSKAAIGVGAFNLVRRSVFERTGGFPWMRLEVVDDMTLGQMMKDAGGRPALVSGRDLVGLHFYRTVGDTARGLEKNVLGACGYSFARLALLFLLLPLIELAPFAAAALPVQTGLRLFAGGVSAAALFVCFRVSRWAGRPAVSALLSPLGMAMLGALGLRAGFLAWRRGGIRWRDTFHSLAELRRHARFRWP